MAKTTDVPHELRAFNKLFSQLEHGGASVRWHYDHFFADFVDFLTESFLPEREGTYERLKKNYGSLDGFVRLMHEWIQTQNQQIVGDKDWYDGLGEYYQVLTSRGKSQILGQYFTPAEVCTMMAMMSGANSELTGKRQTVLDPACGSGRMLLAWHTIAPGNFQYGADLDPICAKMTAVNMCVHGCVGEAVCMDSLRLEWRFGYQINRRLGATSIPSIEPLAMDESRIMGHWLQEKAKKPEQEPVNADKRGQLLLF